MGVYPTQAWCVHRLLERVALRDYGWRWLELGAGAGGIISAANERHHDLRWTAVEIRPECEDPLRALGAEVVIGDARTVKVGDAVPPGRHDVAILNPDYEIAPSVIRAARQRAPVVAALLRLNYLGSEERLLSFADDMPDVLVLPNRPTFVIKVAIPKKGKPSKSTSDNCESAWFIWRELPDGERRRAGAIGVLASTPAEVRREARRLAPVVIEDERDPGGPPAESLLPWLKEHLGPVRVVQKSAQVREEVVSG